MNKRKHLQIAKLRLLHDNVLVLPEELPEHGGVLRPSQYEDKPCIGTVVKVGTYRYFDSGDKEPLDLKVGDMISFNQYSTTKLNIEGTDYHVIRYEDIICVQ